MVLPRTAFLWRSVSFRPLTGIVPDCVLTETMDGLFSPPYGDGTEIAIAEAESARFSPPYGDGTSKGWYL